MPVFLLLLLATLTLPFQALAATHSCLVTTALVEQREQLPRGLLYAIALAESGRWDAEKRMSHAWPWTIRSQADGFVLDDKRTAIATVERLQREGRENIDVGCMQVNLRYHPDAFPDLEMAFEPFANITYAAQFLKNLRAESRSWQRAIEWYHSRDPERGKAYRQRVYGHWRTAQAHINRAHQALARTGWQEAMAQAAPASQTDDGLDLAAVVDTQRREAEQRPASPGARPASAPPTARPAPASPAARPANAGAIEIRRGGVSMHAAAETSEMATLASAEIEPSHAGAIRSPGRRAIHGVDVIRPGGRFSTFYQPKR